MSEPVLNSSDSVQRSALLSTFPWQTDFLLRKNIDVVKDGRFVPLFDVLSEFETALGQVAVIEAADIRRLMSVVDTNTVREIPNMVAYPKKAYRTQLSHVLALYKLIDVLHALGGRSEGRNPMYSRSSAIGITLADRDWLMPDWVDTLTVGNRFFSSLTSFSSSLSTPTSLQTRLFQDLHKLDARHSGVKMLFNVQVAAIHLYFLLSGHKQPSVPALPDIPNTVNQLQSIREGGATSLNPEEITFVHNLMAKHEVFQRRYPLHTALLISPLVLLVDKKLMCHCLDQMKLAMASKALGNQKPRVLVDIELRLWDALLSIASGKASVYSAMNDFFSSVAWDKVMGVSQLDRDFFKPDAARSSSMISILSVENESSINSEWPLAQLRPRPNVPQPALPASPAPIDQAPIASTFVTQQDDMDTNNDFRGPPSPPLSQQHELNNMDTDKEPPRHPPPPAVQQDGVDDLLVGLLPTSPLRSEDGDSRRPSSPQQRASSGSAKTTSLNQQPKTPKPKRESKKREREISLGPNPKKKAKMQATKKPSVRKMEEPTPYQLIGSGSYLEPIDLDAYLTERSVTFKPTDPKRVYGEEVTMFSPKGDQIKWKPEFHFPMDLNSFQTFEKLVRRSYTADGRPPHIATPDKSCFAILSHTEYEQKTPEEIQSLFRDKHIVITDRPRADPPIHFDAAGLRHLTNLDAKINLQDQSINCEDGYYPRQLVIGTLRQVLDASLSSSGPILNALSFPLGLSGVNPSSISTETEAWRVTEGLRFCTCEGATQMYFPVSEMRWGLAATCGGRHWIHIDADGLATFIDLQCGGKWWIVLCPPEHLGKHGFASIRTFLGGFDTNGVDQARWGPRQDGNQDQWRAEAIYLTEGTRFIMRPNTPHLVFTTKHSIVLGGHLYSMSNMQPTFYGIVHCFMGNSLLTNTDHGKTRTLLIRMMQYVYKCLVSGVESDEYSKGHIPDLTDKESLVDVLTLTNFCMLVNVLDFRTYSFPCLSDEEEPSPREFDQRIQWDYNDVSVLDREHFTYVRGLVCNFWTWFDCHYEVTFAGSTSPVPNLERDFCWRYLTDQACALLNYKALAEAESFPGLRFCTLEDLERQIDYLFDNDKGWNSKKANRAKFSTLRFSNMDFTVVKRNLPATFIAKDPFILGMTHGDSLRKLGASIGFPSLKSKLRPHVDEVEVEDEDEDEEVEEQNDDEDDDGDFSPSQRRKRSKT